MYHSINRNLVSLDQKIFLEGLSSELSFEPLIPSNRLKAFPHKTEKIDRRICCAYCPRPRKKKKKKSDLKEFVCVQFAKDGRSNKQGGAAIVSILPTLIKEPTLASLTGEMERKGDDHSFTSWAATSGDVGLPKREKSQSANSENSQKILKNKFPVRKNKAKFPCLDDEESSTAAKPEGKADPLEDSLTNVHRARRASATNGSGSDATSSGDVPPPCSRIEASPPSTEDNYNEDARASERSDKAARILTETDEGPTHSPHSSRNPNPKRRSGGIQSKEEFLECLNRHLSHENTKRRPRSPPTHRSSDKKKKTLPKVMDAIIGPPKGGGDSSLPEKDGKHPSLPGGGRNSGLPEASHLVPSEDDRLSYLSTAEAPSLRCTSKEIPFGDHPNSLGGILGSDDSRSSEGDRNCLSTQVETKSILKNLSLVSISNSHLGVFSEVLSSLTLSVHKALTRGKDPMALFEDRTNHFALISIKHLLQRAKARESCPLTMEKLDISISKVDKIMNLIAEGQKEHFLSNMSRYAQLTMDWDSNKMELFIQQYFRYKRWSLPDPVDLKAVCIGLLNRRMDMTHNKISSILTRTNVSFAGGLKEVKPEVDSDEESFKEAMNSLSELIHPPTDCSNDNSASLQYYSNGHDDSESTLSREDLKKLLENFDVLAEEQKNAVRNHFRFLHQVNPAFAKELFESTNVS